MIEGFDPFNPPQLSREDRAVAGCSCGGLYWHRAQGYGVEACTFWSLDPEQQQAAVADAEAVVKRHGEMLNGMLRAWEAGLRG